MALGGVLLLLPGDLGRVADPWPGLLLGEKADQRSDAPLAFFDAAPKPRRMDHAMDNDGDLLVLEASPSPALDCASVVDEACGVPLPCKNDCIRTPLVRCSCIPATFRDY